jgi:hypothetical protein
MVPQTYWATISTPAGTTCHLAIFSTKLSEGWQEWVEKSVCEVLCGIEELI